MNATDKYTEQAEEQAGNWMRFTSFGWGRRFELERPQDWAIVYTHNRDSGLAEQSNAKAIDSVLEKFGDDVVSERHNHWAVGWMDGYSIRVYDEQGRVTEAFKAWCDLQERLADYPLLDEYDLSERECQVCYDNVVEVVNRVWRHTDRDESLGSVPEGLHIDVYNWFWDHEQDQVENRDGHGGCPSEEAVDRALKALGYPS
jgi:hypothetical protein